MLRPGGKVLIATANKDLYDFNPSPHSNKYYGVAELNDLFARHGFKTEFFGYMPVGDVSMRQRVLRPVKKLAVMLGFMPKSMAGKKFFKKIVFGELVRMPVEIGPQITQIGADLRREKNSPLITRITQSEQKEENTSDLYRGCYVEPDRISSEEVNTSYKVIYCVGSLG